MKATLKLLVCTLVATLVAAPAQAVHPITYRTTHYRCDMGQTVSVSYVTLGATNFAVVNYAGRSYGLAQAVSASGARYANLFGPVTPGNLGSGMEWWEWHGKATLSIFKGSDTSQAMPLMTNCIARR